MEPARDHQAHTSRSSAEPRALPHLDASAPPAARDAWGLIITTSRREAALAYSKAVLSLLAHRADTLQHVEDALAADPELLLGQLLRGFALRLLARRDLLPDALAAVERARACRAARGATVREALLLDALQRWCEGDAEGAITSLARASSAHAECMLSLKLHHALCFMYGRAGDMRLQLTRTLPRLSPRLPGYGYALGCHAFALEETFAYADAERTAHEALAHCPEDAWAYHALLHVLTMQRRTHEGLLFVRARGDRFARGNNFVAHIAWHHALLALAERELDEALVLYDGEIATQLGRDFRDFANCASLLYRLERAGKSVGARWQTLADLAEQRTGDHGLAFADAHYVLALCAAKRGEQAEQFVGSLRTSILVRSDQDARVAGRVGLPLAESLLALWRGDGERALRGLSSLASSLPSLGGSHAQRELFAQLTHDAERTVRRDAFASSAREAAFR